MLEVEGLRAWYGAVEAVRDVRFRVDAGEVLAVVGPNGAGKSTLANAVAGLHRTRSGAVVLDGTDLGSARTVVVARSGIALVPQGRRVFGSCTVREHVALVRGSSRTPVVELDEVLDLFPRLRERWHVRARQLSGGEQQMLAVTRAVLLHPRVLVLDEPTEGLAPGIVSAVAGLVRLLRDRGVGMLLMEQPGPFATGIADRVTEMDRGRLSPPAVSATVTRPSGPGRGDER